MLYVLCLAFIVAVSIQLFYYGAFSVFAFSKDKPLEANQNQKFPVSVLICAKNEAVNLQKNLPAILHQHYDDFQVVLINDASTDDTLDVMETFAEQHANIHIVNVENNEAFWGSKKYALTLGIKAAKHEHLLFIDADCVPNSNLWIQHMASQFTSQKTIVLGYGKYITSSPSLVNLCVQYETLLTAIQYFSYALLGNPYMGVGRNLAYTKSMFFKTKGFINHLYKVNSGDDDLFIQEASTSQNTAITSHTESHTLSVAPGNFSKWFAQKRRHISTARFYSVPNKILLGLFYISKVSLFVFLPFALLYHWQLTTGFLFFYYILQYVVVGLSAKKLGELRVLWFLPILELILLSVHFSIFIANTISKPKHWS